MVLNTLTLKPVLTTNEFLACYEGTIDSNFANILNLDFNINLKYQNDRICPIVQFAKPEDAKEIAHIFKTVYKGTYPYKNMEDIDEISKMINSPNYVWFLFKLDSEENVGCFGARLDFDQKRGFLYGFVIKRDYHKIIDFGKALVGCVLYFWNTYKKKVRVWYGEMRTNEATSQLFTSRIGMKPLAFFPNKDVFFNKIESDILSVTYDDRVLNSLRCKSTPKIIRQILNCYVYTNKRYHLGTPNIENPTLIFDAELLNEIKGKIVKISEKDRFDNELITLSIKDSNSFFKFLYNPFSKNFEKTKYKVERLEELVIFLQELTDLIQKMNINYFQCFVSSYEPSHQKIFYDGGFIPRGYIPSWYYNKESNIFEDRVVFNCYKGDIDNNIKLIPETEDLIENLKISIEKAIPDFSNLFQE